ncbi:MAG: phosphodiesterase [Sphingomonas bacterium]|nr:phosphodiesterase [Sphingomonas bacterium]
MLIAQISDLHLGFVADDPQEMNAVRLDAVIDRILSLPRQPDLMLATGDLVERGDLPSYRRLRDKLSRVPFPVHYALGNHDLRAAFLDIFPETPTAEGFVQYALDAGPIRLLVLDTLEEGRHGGSFCEARAAWLVERLEEAPNRPTLVVLHHPPIPTGIGWMTTDPREPWAERLASAIQGRTNVLGLVCGHVHRPILAPFAGVSVAVCPSTAPAVEIGLEPIAPDVLDGRPMIVNTAPAYALHLWEGDRLVTHYDRAERAETIMGYDESMRAIVRKVFAERPKG